MNSTLLVMAIGILLGTMAPAAAQGRVGPTPTLPGGKPATPPKPPLPPPIPPTGTVVGSEGVSAAAGKIDAPNHTKAASSDMVKTPAGDFLSLIIRSEGCLKRASGGGFELMSGAGATVPVTGSVDLGHHVDQFVEVRGSIIAAAQGDRTTGATRFTVSEIRMVRAECVPPATPAPDNASEKPPAEIHK